MKKRILIVEDDLALARVLADNLTFAGYEVEHLDDGAQVVSRVRAMAPDLVLLDVMLPGKDGFGLLGLISAVVMVVLSKAVWVQTLGFSKELFPYDNPAILSMPIAFVGIWAFSRLDTSQRAKAEIAAYDAQYIRSETGIGATAAHVH